MSKLVRRMPNTDSGHRHGAPATHRGLGLLKPFGDVLRRYITREFALAVIEWLKAFVHAPIPSDTDWPCLLPGEPTKRVVLVERNIRHDAGAVLSASLKARGAI